MADSEQQSGPAEETSTAVSTSENVIDSTTNKSEPDSSQAVSDSATAMEMDTETNRVQDTDGAPVDSEKPAESTASAGTSGTAVDTTTTEEKSASAPKADGDTGAGEASETSSVSSAKRPRDDDEAASTDGGFKKAKTEDDTTLSPANTSAVAGSAATVTASKSATDSSSGNPPTGALGASSIVPGSDGAGAAVSGDANNGEVQTAIPTPGADGAPAAATASGAPVAETREKRNTNQLIWVQQKLMKKLVDHPQAWPFRKPVDPVALNLVNYFDIIKKPMDLSTVKKNLKNRNYWTVSEAINDLRQIYQNCRTYNPPTDDVVVMGNNLEKVMDEMIEKEMPKEEIVTASKQSHKAKRIDTLTSPASIGSLGFGGPPSRRSSSRPVRPTNKDMIDADLQQIPLKKKGPKAKQSNRMKFCSTVIRELLHKKHNHLSWAFREPVNPVLLNIPDYFKVLEKVGQKPMDLGTVKKNLEWSRYETPEEFHSDVQMIFKNCFVYNPEDHDINKLGKQLQMEYLKLMQKEPKDDPPPKSKPKSSSKSDRRSNMKVDEDYDDNGEDDGDDVAIEDENEQSPDPDAEGEQDDEIEVDGDDDDDDDDDDDSSSESDSSENEEDESTARVQMMAQQIALLHKQMELMTKTKKRKKKKTKKGDKKKSEKVKSKSSKKQAKKAKSDDGKKKSIPPKSKGSSKKAAAKAKPAPKKSASKKKPAPKKARVSRISSGSDSDSSSSSDDDNERVMSWEEKRTLSEEIHQLEESQLPEVITIVKDREKGLKNSNPEEIEIDFNQLSNGTLWALQDFLTNCKKKASAAKAAKQKKTSTKPSDRKADLMRELENNRAQQAAAYGAPDDR